MKTISIVLAQLVAISAYANPSLVKTVSNGALPREYQSSISCKIEGRTVTLRSQLACVPPKEEKKPVRFTRLVPNEFVMESLIIEASRGEIEKYAHIPAGGSRTTYMANTHFAPVTLLTLDGQYKNTENLSYAAKILEQFLEQNCSN